MLIAIEQLEEWAADPYMRKWFVKRFPSGSAEYQAVLDALSEENEVWLANYLMDRAGADESVIHYLDAPYSGKNLFCAGRLVSHTEIHVTGSLRAGTSIVAKGKIIASVSIRAGTEITSRCSIYGGRYISAGESVIAAWNIEADAIYAGANIVSKEAIKTEYDIYAGGNIKAGWNITAGRKIEAKSFAYLQGQMFMSTTGRAMH